MEENSPYAASRVSPASAASVDWRDQPPREITRPITLMWSVLAFLGGIVVIGGGALFAFSEASRASMAPLLIIGFIYLALAFGVYKRSRVVATLVLLFFAFALLGTLANIVQGKSTLVGAGLLVIFAFVSVRGTLATYRYHRHLRDVRSRPPRSRLSDDPAFAPKIDPAL